MGGVLEFRVGEYIKIFLLFSFLPFLIGRLKSRVMTSGGAVQAGGVGWGENI